MVPFSKPTRLDESLSILSSSALLSKMSGDGEFSKKVRKLLEDVYRAPVLLTGSATHALEMMDLLLDLKPSDEVIVPSFSFVSCANAFVLRGARIRFADCDENGQILLSEIKRLYNVNTKAVLVMNYAGGSADLDSIVDFCKSKSIAVCEDAAQSIGAKYRNKPLGGFGDLGCISFHDTKNINCGEGGALIINNQSYYDRAEIIREKGTNRAKFFQGLVDKYTWVDLGSSYLLSDLNSAFLLPQLEQLDYINARRKAQWHKYEASLRSHQKTSHFRILNYGPYNQPNYHLFALVFENTNDRAPFISFMKERQIVAPFHYLALHSSPFGEQYLEPGAQLNNTDQLSNSLVRLPLFHSMTEEQQERVLESALEFFARQ